jgi:hypothetical protein
MSRSKSFNEAMLATNHMLDGDIDHGAKVGRYALEIAENIKSARVRDRMKPLRDEAEKRRNNSDARDLAERLNKFMVA